MTIDHPGPGVLTPEFYYLLVGTYANPSPEGLYLCSFDAAKGSIDFIEKVAAENPSFLQSAAGGALIYCVNENTGEDAGQVSSFALDKKSQRVTPVVVQPSGGSRPCYLSVNATQDWVIAANYESGSISALPTNPKGLVGSPTQIIPHKELIGKNKKAHAHSAVFTPDELFLLVADLGLDAVISYSFDARAEKEPLRFSGFIDFPEGNGPRHIAFHPNSTFVFVSEELSGTVSVLRYEKGFLELIERVDCHPPGYRGKRATAHLHVSPDGRFLYVSNRGAANNLAVFTIDVVSGRLSNARFYSSLGRTPRHFILDPHGRYVLVANQDSHQVVVFKRDAVTGSLSATGVQCSVPHPVCLELIPAEGQASILA